MKRKILVFLLVSFLGGCGVDDKPTSFVYPTTLIPGLLSTGSTKIVCVTFYTPFEDGGYDKSTGGKLTEKSVAVDPKIIPYGSVVSLPGFSQRVAEDTGTDVKSKRASRARALKLLKSNSITYQQYETLKNAPVVDVFVSTKKEYTKLCNTTPEFLEATIQ